MSTRLTSRSSLITFNNSAMLPKVRRQAMIAQVYNVTQDFAATAGATCELSAYATEAQNGDSHPDCAVKICGDTSCGSSEALTASYQLYSYQNTLGSSESSAMATLSIQCADSAYVALDNITVMASNASAAPNTIPMATTTVTHYITRTQTLLQTASLNRSNITLTATTTVEIENSATKVYNITNTVPNVVWSTATEVVAIAATKYFNLNVSDVSTTTSKSSSPNLMRTSWA